MPRSGKNFNFGPSDRRNTEKCIYVSILQDDIVEYPENFLLTLTVIELNFNPQPISRQVTILDDSDGESDIFCSYT